MQKLLADILKIIGSALKCLNWERERERERESEGLIINYDIVIINYDVVMILIILRIPSIILFTIWIKSSTVPSLFLSIQLAVIIRILLIGMDVERWKPLLFTQCLTIMDHASLNQFMYHLTTLTPWIRKRISKWCGVLLLLIMLRKRIIFA